MKIKKKFYAIIDIRGDIPSICVSDYSKTKSLMSIYNKKPVIPKEWDQFKKVVRVIVEFKIQ